MESETSVRPSEGNGASTEQSVEELQRLLSEVEALSEVWRGFGLMKKHDVPRQGCSNLDDIKERLRLHFKKLHGKGSPAATAENVIGHVQEADALKRTQLMTLLQETQSLFQQMDEQVWRHLHSEGINQEQLTQHIVGLRSNRCPILVTGETSSGKSSLLNLLLGQEVLPHRLLSCTSCTCRLSYDADVHAKVHTIDGQEEDISLSGEQPLVDQLEKYIFNAEDRQEEFNYKEVEIFMPLDILKHGVHIIDSPGFGENAQVDKMLLDYITQNDIFAFIYVIKSDNAGGVQEDRLQKILQTIVEHHKGQTVNRFDPRAAIFVGNRWDLVPDTEKELVKKDSFEKLSHCWPELKENQVFYMSTTKAWTNLQAGYVSEDYGQFLEGIQHLIPVGLQAKISHPFKWLEHFLRRTLHHVASYLASTKLSSKELRARHATAQLRLHRVEKEADVVMKKLTKRVDKSVQRISRKLSEFLRTEDVKKRLSIWSLEELPMVAEHDVWAEVEPEVDAAIERRFTELLQDWDTEHRMFLKVQLELLTAFKEEFLLLETQLSTVEQCLHQKSTLGIPQTPQDASSYQGLTQNVSAAQEGHLDFSLDFLQKLALGISTPVLLPVAIGLIIGAPIFFLWDLKKWRRRSLSLKNLSNYIEDPVQFVTNRAHLFLSKVAEMDNVSEYVFTQLEPARMYLESMKSAIPKLVESNHMLMESILKDRRTSHEIEEKYSRFQILIPEIQEKLAAFGNLHTRRYDFQAADIEVVPEEQNSSFQIPRKVTGIWTAIAAAKVCKDGKTKTVSTKVYLPMSKVQAMHLASEETHFRKVYHPCIAHLIGSFESQRGIPGLVLEEGLVPARKEVFGFRLLARASLETKGRNAIMDRCSRVLEQIGVGLEYLHYRDLVHLELSLDTVMMVAKRDVVKLVNLSEPRVVHLPEEDVNAGHWVYLPPEVLQGKEYTSQGDMYALGLLAWELGNQELVFKPQRLQPLKQVAQEIAQCPVSTHEDISPFKCLIQSCVTGKSGERPCSTTWVNEIRAHITPQHASDEER